MARPCPYCGGNRVESYTKEVDGGVQRFESCRDCRFRCTTGSQLRADGPRRDVRGGLSGLRRRRRERKQGGF